MAWTTFANLTAPTLPALDGNYGILTALSNVPVAIAGTNSLVLTNQAGAATITAYQNGLTLNGVATATNTGATAAQLGSLPAINCYTDTGSGPVALTGGEIIQNCEVTFIYDSTLNAGAGGFHVRGGGAPLVNQTVAVGGLVVNGGPAVLGMPSGLFTLSFGSIVPGTFAQVSVTSLRCAVGDLVLLTLGNTQAANIILSANIPSASLIVVRAQNTGLSTGATVTPASSPYRLTVLRYS